MAADTRTKLQVKAIVRDFDKNHQSAIKALIIYFEAVSDAWSNVRELRNRLFDHYNTASGHTASGHTATAHAGVWADEMRDDMNYVHGALAALERLDANEEEKAQ